ncbi:hypothetical protein Salat_1424500 [Sesamum alatum]|uniref:Myb/SANT-like domain-containing protein n=1 Tax=Sesamum alatum TaxID=300844 RepID=A0AAE2CLQ6_9LAMI|nr:hypothetical protein Salat_1424500 [Sesamum alatum]
MSAYGHFWQQKLFYCQHWTPEIEGTFVQSLLAHHRKGSFHHERVNCHAVLCALFNIHARFCCTLSYSYCQRRLEKLKIRSRVFSWITSLAAMEWDPKTNQISVDNYLWEQIAKDEDVYFDRAGTCLDDEWVHNGPPPSEESSDDNSYCDIDDSGKEDLSWWAFIQVYYASNSGTASVNKHPSTICRPTTSGYGTPKNQSPQRDAATPNSCASNDLDIRADTPSPYVPKYLRRRQRKKPKF